MLDPANLITVASIAAAFSSLDSTLAGLKFVLDIIADLAVLLGVPIAAITIFVQIRSSRFAAKFDNLWKLDGQWQDMHTTRAVVAQALIQLRSGTQSALAQVGEEVRDILDFFDMVGLLVHQDAVDLKMAWNDFAVWTISYWRLLGDWVTVNRHGDNTLWNEYEWLYGQVLPMEARARKITEDDAAKFYDNQAADLLLRESQLKP